MAVYPKVSQSYSVQRDVTVDITSVPAGSVQEESFTVKGLDTDMVVVVNKQSRDSGLYVLEARVSAADTLAVTFWNPTGAAIDPASQTLRVVAL